MAKPQVFDATFIEDSGWTALARVENPSGSLITIATVSTIACRVYNGNTVTTTPTVTVASSVFDTLQGASGTDARWTADSIGYNFRFEVPATAFPAHGHDYQVEFLFTPSSGEPFALIWRGSCLELRGS